MGNYQGYQKYKDSGVEWLGEIPEHWEVKRIKYAFLLQRGYDLSREEMEEGKYPVCASNGIIGNHIKHNVKAPSITVGRSGSVGEVHYIDFDFWAHNTALYVKSFINSDPKFIFYLLKTLDIKSLSWGTAVGSLNRNYIHDLFTGFPPLNEQEKIAQFLDYKAKQIDELIKKKETLIEKLDEKRTAIISHAVTKGLDSSVPMKDSGIEWLGDIPKHWKIIPIKRFSQIYDCKHKTVSFVDDGIPVASIAQVQNFYIDLLIAKMTTKEEFIEMIEGGRKPQNGDIILSRNATVGASAIVQDDLFCMGQDVCLIRPVKANSVFLNYNFLAFFTKSQIDTCLLGSTFKRINVEEVKNLLICLPLLEEQKQIAQYLDQKTAQIDQQKAKIKQAIELLKEYRTSLITNAVTGKIDVSQIVIPSPQKPQPQKG